MDIILISNKTITFKNPNWYSNIGEVAYIRLFPLQITIIKTGLNMKEKQLFEDPGA